jgi:Kef-type K+ transport system membrane component KefB
MAHPLALILAAGGNIEEMLPFGLFVVFASSLLLAELAERMHIPGIVGGMAAGLLIGPSGLGLVQYDSVLHALSEIGVMFLLFQVGLEVKPSQLLKVGRTALLVAVLGVALPFAAGWGIFTLAGFRTSASLFMGAAMVATSVGITAQVLSAQGYLSHRASQVILAAAVIDDVLGLLVLATVSSLGSSGRIDFIGIGVSALTAIGFVVAVFHFGPSAAHRMVPRLTRRMRTSESEFAIALLFLLGMSALAIRSGVAAIVGAFLAGMALSETVSPRVHVLSHGASRLMIPFFLAGIGLQMDLSPFRSWSALSLALVVLVAAMASKAIGCGCGALGLGWGDALRVGVGMIPRGEVGLVVAQVGLTAGVVSHEGYGIAVSMAVLTTAIAPPLLRLAYRNVRPEAHGATADA